MLFFPDSKVSKLSRRDLREDSKDRVRRPGLLFAEELYGTKLKINGASVVVYEIPAAGNAASDVVRILTTTGVPNCG
jgi:hypothetical protein